MKQDKSTIKSPTGPLHRIASPAKKLDKKIYLICLMLM
jgi:hypothetical protein